MPDYTLQQLATYHNSRPRNHAEFRRRQNLVNNTPYYTTGHVIRHLKVIQMDNEYDWYSLFWEQDISPDLQIYALDSIRYAQGEINNDPGQMEISMMMERNFNRPGRHIAIIFVHLFPHQQFNDGHVVHIEFDEGSFIDRTIERLFDTQNGAVIAQATEYDMLKNIAREDEMLELLDLFLRDFNPMRFGFDGDDYFVDPEAPNIHVDHDFCLNQLECIMNGVPYGIQELIQELVPAIENEVAGADDEINQGFYNDEDDIIIINNDFINNNNNNIINNNDFINNNNDYLNNYIYNYIIEPNAAEPNYREQG